MNIAVTGHRPEDISNLDWVEEQLVLLFKEFSPEKVYIGMAAGVDLLAGKICIENGFPIVASKPWAGHTPRVSDSKLYNYVVNSATETVNVDSAEKYPGVWVYHNRNKFMVDNAELVLAVWTGKQTGGTAACVRYAKQKRKNILQVNPDNMTVSMLNSQHGLF